MDNSESKISDEPERGALGANSEVSQEDSSAESAGSDQSGLVKPEFDSTEVEKDADQPPDIPQHKSISGDDNQIEPAVKPPKQNFFKKFLRPKLILPRSLSNKLGRAATPVASLIILLVVGGIAYGAVSTVHNHTSSSAKIELAVTPIKPFQVVSTIPSSGEKNVQDGSKITINFDQPVSASKLQNAFIITPTMNGSITQGSNSQQIIFTPNVAFNNATIVKVMIDNSFQSQLGQKLSSDYLLGFTTQTPADGVEFQYQNDFVNLVSAQSSTNVPITLNVGSQVDPNGQVVIYRASLDPLLESLEYNDVTSNGYTYKSPYYYSVDTASMQQLSSSTGLKDQSEFNVNEPNGIYLVAAIASGKQVGWTWVVFNDNGTIMRQDYQQIVLSTFNLTTNALVDNANVTFYNLENGVDALKTASLQSPEAFNFPYSQQVDLAVVTVGQDTMVVPISVPNSLADSRVSKDLSQTRSFYAVTDKPAYQVNDTLKFAGYVNIDNDAQFTPDQENSINLFVASQDNPSDHLEDFTAPVNSNGTFNGQFTITSALSNQQDLAIYGYQDLADQNPISIASFAVTNAPSNYTVSVAFNKTDYLASDTVNATITATQSNGQPLANTSVTYNIYSKPYYENNPTENLDSFGAVGDQVGSANQTAQLNGKGQATVAVSVSQLKLLTQGSQVVTVQASKTDSTGAVAGGGASAVVHQGNIILTFGVGKTYFSQDDTRFARLYATNLSGKPLAGATINYQFVTYSFNNTTQEETPTVIGSGSGTTDSNGYLQISQQLNTSDNVTIIASSVDNYGNEVEAEQYTTTDQGNTPEMAGADNLDYLDVSGSNGDVTVGDQVALTITSPQSLNVLVSYERGKIYSYRTLQLNQGANSYSLDVTPQLAPSFNLIFSYFIDGVYHTEGTSFTVTNPQQELNLSITPDHNHYSSGQTANITINSTNASGQAVPANLIVAVESDSMFNLGTSFEPDMYTYYYATREYSTNSSSSLTGIGSGGGKCGGGGFSGTGLASNSGTTLYWNPNIATDSNGNTTTNVPLQSGKWHVLVYAMGSGASVGSAQTTISAE